MSVQSVDNRWIENGITQPGINGILTSAFRTLTTGGPGYCNQNMDKVTTLPGQGTNATQIILDKNPYGPANCDQYATLIKPGVNPLTLRGKSNSGVNNPVNDSPICLESCDYNTSIGPVFGMCSSNCIRNTQYCIGSECKNDAPGGLADWMGRPKSGGNNGVWGSAINNQLAGGREGTNGYLNPIRLNLPDQMKFGFVTDGCECQDGTSRIAGGTFYDWAQTGSGSGPHTLNTDSNISSEVWNGQGTCNTWQNFNSTDIRQSTCNLDIVKYAQTCAWCKSAVLTIPGVQPDQTYPPKTTIDNRDTLGVGTVTTSPTYCTFRIDSSGNYTIDNGDCLGFGVNGKARIPCNHPTVQSYNCPVTTPVKQKIGLFCNVPAGNRLTGASCAFVQPQDLNYMTIGTGNSMNNYYVTYTNGPFNVNITGDTSTLRTGNNGDMNGDYTGIITGGKQINITFPDGTLASELMRLLKTNTAFTSQIDISASLATGVSLSNPQSSAPPPISSTFNIALPDSNKTTFIGNITYLYRYSSDYPGYSGSYFDGNIQIQYTNGSLGVTYSGNWHRASLTDQGLNIIQISFPNNYDGASLVDFLNQQFQSSSIPQVHNLIASGGSGPQMSYHSTYYYGFAQGGDSKTGGLTAPGNCNVHLDGSIFTGTWAQNATYRDPTSDVVETWIGKDGLKCDYNPNQGSCQTMFYDPAATGDCQICDSEFWKWIPGGVEAVLDPSNILHNLAVTAYIPKFQDLKNAATCNQSILGGGSTANSVSFCGKDNGNNRCTVVCGQSCVEMSWDTSLASSATIVQNLVPDTGGVNNYIPSGNCPNTMCERNPVLTLRGTSEEENNKLVTNWMDGIFDLSELHGRSTGIQNTTTPDLRAYGIPEELKKRTIKALRCCLGVNPGFQSSDGGLNGGPKTTPDKDPYGGLEMWDLYDCPPGVMCPSSNTCKELYKSVLDGSNEHVKMDLNDFGAPNYPTGFSLDRDTTNHTSEDILLNPAYYAKAYCEMMSGGSTKTMTTVMGLDDEINTLCRKAMYNYCISPVEVEVIDNANYWNAPIGASTPPDKNTNYSKTTYELPLKIFTQGCNMWFKNKLQEVMPSDYGTRDMLLGSACQRLQVDGWYNPVGPDQSPLLQAFVTKDGKINDTSGMSFDLSYVGSASVTSGAGSIPDLLAKTCNCFLLGSKCQGSSGSNCSYQYCGAGIEDPLTIDFGHDKGIIDPLNQPVDLTPYSSKLGPDGSALGDSSWTKYQDIVAPSWSTGLDPKTFTCAKGSAPQGMALSQDEAGGSSNCFTGCNFVNEYDVCWNASPTNRKYSGELLGGETKWNCNFSEGFTNTNTCDPSKSDSYSCFGECEHGNTKKDGSQFPSCGTQTWFDSDLSLNPGEIKVKQNRTSGRSDVMDTPYWQNFYSGASEQVSSASIPNIGSVYNPSRSILASDSICGSVDSIKPYNLKFTSQNQCIISQGVSVNNQGTITGSVGVSQLGSCNTTNIFQGHDQYAFLTYMGTTDCTGKNQTCWDNNSFCLTDGSTTNADGIPAGENCAVCGNSGISLIDTPDKPNTCCLDPSLGGNDRVYQAANTSILRKVTLGDTPVVSYFCSGGTCPIGSTDLATLQTSCGSGFTCQGATDQTSCEGCKYCRWQPIYSSGYGGVPIDTGSKHCVAACPTAPQNGWLAGGITQTSIPTSSPTVESTAAPNTGINTVSNLSGTDIALIAIGIIIFIAFAGNSVVVWNQSRKGGNSFGKIKSKGATFGKRKRHF